MAKFPLRKVANNTWKADSTREEEEAKKCQFMSPCTPGASGLNSVPVGLQALKEETRGKHTCDLNRKEERSPVDASVVETEASQNPHLRLGKLSFQPVARRAG